MSSFMIDDILSSTFSSKRKISNENEINLQNKRVCLDVTYQPGRSPFQPIPVNYNTGMFSFAALAYKANNPTDYLHLNSSGYSTSSSNCSSFTHDNTNDSEEDIIDVGSDKENLKSKRVKKEWNCETCHKVFDRPSLLQRHIRTHTGEKPHACDVCGKAFSTSSSLNTHVRIHSGEKPHECNVCGKKFTASSNLYYHKLTHTTEKPHKCTKCTKSFSTPGDLRAHLHTHNGTWPFKCELCSKGFTKQTNLKNHLLTHTGAKPFNCLKCDKQFSLACNLKSHMKSHHGHEFIKSEEDS